MQENMASFPKVASESLTLYYQNKCSLILIEKVSLPAAVLLWRPISWWNGKGQPSSTRSSNSPWGDILQTRPGNSSLLKSLSLLKQRCHLSFSQVFRWSFVRAYVSTPTQATLIGFTPILPCVLNVLHTPDPFWGAWVMKCHPLVLSFCIGWICLSAWAYDQLFESGRSGYCHIVIRSH